MTFLGGHHRLKQRRRRHLREFDAYLVIPDHTLCNRNKQLDRITHIHNHRIGSIVYFCILSS